MKWTKEEVKYLRAKYKELSLKELNKHIEGHTKRAITCKARRLNLTHEYKYWTKKEVQYLMNNWGSPNKVLANKLDRTVKSIKNKKTRCKHGT